MKRLKWDPINDSGVYWARDKKFHSFILKLPSSHPSSLTISLLESISGYNALAKRLEVYAKFCSSSWERNFKTFLNLIPLHLDKKIMAEMTCISLVLEENQTEFGNLGNLSNSLLNLDCGLFTTTKEDDMSDLADNMFLIYFDEQQEENFNQMLKRIKFSRYVLKPDANGNGESSCQHGEQEGGTLSLNEELRLKRKREKDKYHSLLKKMKEDGGLKVPEHCSAKHTVRRPVHYKPGTSKSHQTIERKITTLDIMDINITDLLGGKERNYVIEDLISAGSFRIKTCLRRREDNSRLVMKVVAFSDASSTLIKSTRFDCMAIEGNKEESSNIVTIYGHRILKGAAQLTGFCSSNLSQFLSSFCSTIEKTEVSLFVFEERTGSTVQDWLTQHDMDLIDKDYRVREKIGKGVVCGMKYLHGKDIVHSDLKLDNLYFTSGFQCPVKIADYESNEVKCSAGLSRWQQALLYSSEGEAHNFKIDDKTADWFSYGTILFQLFYTQQVMMSDVKTVLESIPQIAIDIPELPGLKRIVLGLTGEDNKERSKIIKELKQDTSSEALLASSKIGQSFSVFRVTHNSMCS